MDTLQNIMSEFPGCEIDPSVEGCIDRIRDLYNAPFARMMGIEPTYISKDEIRMKMTVKPEFKNSHGICHGAAIYALADHTFAFASNLFVDATGQNTNTTYHRPVTCDVLESVSKVINESRNLHVFDIRIYGNGKLISSGVYTAFKINRG